MILSQTTRGGGALDRGADCYERYLEGDDEAIVDLVGEYRDGLTFYLNRFVSNIYEAEELAEETFFRLIVRKPRYRGKYMFKTWLYTIGRNIAIDYMRRGGKTTQISDEDIKNMRVEEQTLEDMCIAEERSKIVHRALSNLREEYRDILHLIFFEEMTNAEASTVMKKSRRQTETLIYRAKAALRREIEKEGYSYEEL